HAGETFTLASDWPGGADPVPRTGHLHETFALCCSQGCGLNSPMEVASQVRTPGGGPTRLCAGCTLSLEDRSAVEFPSRLLGRLVGLSASVTALEMLQCGQCAWLGLPRIEAANRLAGPCGSTIARMLHKQLHQR